MIPLGLLSAHNGTVSCVFKRGDHGDVLRRGNIEAYSGLLALVPAPESCPPGISEAFVKADKSLRKIAAAVSQSVRSDSDRPGNLVGFEESESLR